MQHRSHLRRLFLGTASLSALTASALVYILSSHPLARTFSVLLAATGTVGLGSAVIADDNNPLLVGMGDDILAMAEAVIPVRQVPRPGAAAPAISVNVGPTPPTSPVSNSPKAPGGPGSNPRVFGSKTQLTASVQSDSSTPSSAPSLKKNA